MPPSATALEAKRQTPHTKSSDRAERGELTRVVIVFELPTAGHAFVRESAQSDRLRQSRLDA
jgi:hypothetical protein